MQDKVIELLKAKKSIREIAKELDITYNKARDFVNSDSVKEALNPTPTNDRLLGLDKALLEMQPDAVATLKYHLKERNIHAFDLWVRALTREKQAPQQQAMIVKLSSGIDIKDITLHKEENVDIIVSDEDV